MLDSEDEFGSEENDSERDQILTGGGDYECSLNETPKDVQRKYQRMQEVNAIYNTHEATKTDVQEGGE